jgi:hypothetical protein
MQSARMASSTARTSLTTNSFLLGLLDQANKQYKLFITILQNFRVLLEAIMTSTMRVDLVPGHEQAAIRSTGFRRGELLTMS